MKRLALLAILLAASTGCRGGIIDRLFHGDIFRGDSCGACGYTLPQGNVGCNNCATGSVGANYGTYEGEVLGSGVIDGTVVDPGYYGPAVIDGPIINSTQGSGTTMAPLSGT